MLDHFFEHVKPFESCCCGSIDLNVILTQLIWMLFSLKIQIDAVRGKNAKTERDLVYRRVELLLSRVKLVEKTLFSSNKICVVKF